MKWIKENLWRHSVAIAAVLFAAFPLYLVIVTSFASSGSLQLTSFIPNEISMVNYDKLFNDPTIPYLTWVWNSLLIAGSVALLSVVIGAADRRYLPDHGGHRKLRTRVWAWNSARSDSGLSRWCDGREYLASQGIR